MALFRNLCVNLRNYLFPPWGGTRNSLISLSLRKIAHFCIGNFICAQYKFMDGHELSKIVLSVFFSNSDSQIIQRLKILL
jgi:hypothetical protein